MDDIEMKKMLVAFSKKYHGNFPRIVKALQTQERLSKDEIDRYVNSVEELTLTIKSKKFPKALHDMKAPPIVIYYDGNLDLLDKSGTQIWLPITEKLGQRAFIALEKKGKEMDYCIAVEDEDNLSYIIETMIDFNPQFKFVDYSRKKDMDDKMVK